MALTSSGLCLTPNSSSHPSSPCFQHCSHTAFFHSFPRSVSSLCCLGLDTSGSGAHLHAPLPLCSPSQPPAPSHPGSSHDLSGIYWCWLVCHLFRPECQFCATGVLFPTVSCVCAHMRWILGKCRLIFVERGENSPIT